MAKQSGPPKSSAPKNLAKSKLREIRALDLRAKGNSYQEIADDLGISIPGARKCVIRAMEALTKEINEKAEEVRQLELTRLDTMLRLVMDEVDSGNINAIDKGVKIMERRAKLLGLDRPTQMDVLVSTPQQIREENRIKIMDAHPEMTDEEVEIALNTIENME